MQGFLLLNKPEGITSFGAVARIKRLTKEKRVGHTGTLDPMATGVLPIFIGKATALSSHLLDADKSYSAVIRLGITTDTCDITGNIIEEKKVTVDNNAVLNMLESFRGRIEQTPPMYSALKKDGVRLYELARKGLSVDIPKREVEIFSLESTSSLNENNEFSIDVTVSKGTYIRSLCRDIGEKLGCGATLTALCRTAASGFSLDECISLDQLSEENISDFIVSEETALSHLPSISVTRPQAVRFSNGGQLAFDRIKIPDTTQGALYRVKYGEIFLGLGMADSEQQQLAVKCVINNIGREG